VVTHFSDSTQETNTIGEVFVEDFYNENALCLQLVNCETTNVIK